MNVPAPSTTSNFIGQQNPAYQLQQSGYDLNNLPQVSATGQNISTGISTAGSQPFTNSQLGLLSQLGAQASGTGGPTVAQQQLTSGVNANLASALAAGASSNGLGQNPGDAAKGIQTNLAGINANAAGQAAATRAGEIQSAQGQLGSLSVAGGAQAAQQAQAQQAATAQGQMFGATQAQQANEYNTGLAAAQQAQYNQALTGLATQNQASNNQLENQVLNPSTYLNMVGGGAQGLGAIASDESVKAGISAEAATANQFLSALGQYMKPTGAPELQPLTSTNKGSMPSGGGGPNVDAGQAATLTNAVTTPAAATDAGAAAGQMLSDERSKDHIDKLTNLLGQAIGGRSAAAPTGNTDRPAFPGMAAAQPGVAYAPPPPPPQAAPAQAPAAEPQVSYPPAPEVRPGMDLTNPNSISTCITPQMMQSDENEKKLVDHLQNHSYQYKDPSMPGAAPGTHFGPMAQELEKAGPIGASTVSTGPDGVKRVDTGRLSLALAGALGAMNNRVETLEQALEKAHGKKAKAA